VTYQSRRRSFGSRLALLTVLLLASEAAGQPNSEYSEERGNACLDCHQTGRVMGILETAHANFDDPRTPAAQRQCQSCHGPSKVHMQFPMQVANVHFTKDSKSKPEVQNRRCLECHQNGERSNWMASAHGFEHLVCSTCHNVHSPTKIIPPREETVKGCTASGCHDGLKAIDPSEFAHLTGGKFSAGGSIVCSDCHNPHGRIDSVRCLTCHEQKPADLATQSVKAQRFHAVAVVRGTECIRCHRGLAHPLPDDVLEAARREQQPTR
jgi:hypothetical protein